MNKCIYHSIDLDGWTSAAIVKHKFPKCELIGYNYGQKVPFDKIEKGDRVIMCDISFSPEDLKKLIEKTSDVIWIDHHISAIKDYEEAIKKGGILEGIKLPGKRSTKKAACELTWEYLYPNKKMPETVELLGLYDSFRHKGTENEDKVLMFQYGARAYFTDPHSCMRLLQTAFPVEKLVEKGESIYKYLCVDAKNAYEQSFPIEIEDNKFAASNKERMNPINFGINYHKDGYDGFASFWFSGKHWNWSLYSDNDKTDCSKICKKYGGGGHFGAAGMEMSNDEFNKFLKNKLES